MEIKIGNYDVWEKGSIISCEAESIEFILDKATKYILRLEFEDDSENPERKANADRFGDNGVRIKFTNYNGTKSIGNVKPIRIGILQNRELFFSYCVTALEIGKNVYYTFLLGKEVKNG